MKNKTKILLMGTLLGIFLSGLVYFLFAQPSWKRQQIALQKSQERHQAALIEAIRKNGLVVRMSNLMETINQELNQSPDRSLSEVTISRIAALSTDLDIRPYYYFQADTLRDSSYSVERGQLLWLLYQMQIDSHSFAKIKQQSTFARADLAGKKLDSIDLSGAYLRGAHFKKASLVGAKFQGADLRAANFWGANLYKADFRKASLHQADLSWASLHYSDFREAVCRGSTMDAAQLNHADLRKAIMHNSSLEGAIFNQANLEEVRLFYTDLEGASFWKANMYKADVQHSYFYDTQFTEADLREANFDRARVEDKNWLAQLSNWNAQGVEEIQTRFQVEEDNSGRAKYRIRVLKK
ncbi:MAG: pentapeptide repeat-containing protein [Bacteroidota bacterium]